jgi:hypothetical protein
VTSTSRQTIYRALEAGRLTWEPDGTIDTAELLRAGFSLQAALPPEAPLSPDVQPPELVAILEERVVALARERDLLQRALDNAPVEKARLLTLLESQPRLLEVGAAPWPLGAPPGLGAREKHVAPSVLSPAHADPLDNHGRTATSGA